MSNQAPTEALCLVPRRAVYDWLRDDVPLNVKMTVMHHHIDALMDRLSKAAPASQLPGGGCLGAKHLSGAIKRLTGITAGDEGEAVYADFPFPIHTFHADLRALLSALPAAPTGEA